MTTTVTAPDQINLVTSMHRGGYEQYGQRMISDFLAKWPDNARLTIYAEDFEVAERSDRLEVIDLHEACPDLVAFKQRNKEKWKNGFIGTAAHKDKLFKATERYKYKWDATKFANKVYAYCEHARRTRDRYLVWLDADTITVKPIPDTFIQSLGDAFIVFLGRRYTHSECGFLRFDMQFPRAMDFFETMRAMYETGEIFTLNEWHDSFIFDTVRSVMTASGAITTHSISKSGEIRHPFIHSPLGDYMDHLKGDTRKARGSSSRRDRREEKLPEKILRKLKIVPER